MKNLIFSRILQKLCNLNCSSEYFSWKTFLTNLALFAILIAFSLISWFSRLFISGDYTVEIMLKPFHKNINQHSISEVWKSLKLCAREPRAKSNLKLRCFNLFAIEKQPPAFSIHFALLFQRRFVFASTIIMHRHKYPPWSVENFSMGSTPKFNSASCMLQYTSILYLMMTPDRTRIYELDKSD